MHIFNVKSVRDKNVFMESLNIYILKKYVLFSEYYALKAALISMIYLLGYWVNGHCRIAKNS